MKLLEENDDIIPASKMMDGDIGIIIDKGLEYNNTIMQRYKNSLIVLGKPSGQSWSDNINELPFMVKVLPAGTKLII